MSTSLEVTAGLTKLARTLEVPVEDVEFLADVDLAELRTVRWEIEDRLAAAHLKRLRTVVAAAKLVPNGLAATLGERWFGPVLCAKLVGLVEPARGGQYARHLSLGFMADITARTDPRVVGALVPELRVKDLQRIALELLEREDHLTLSHFVGHVPPSVVVDVLEAVDDNAAVVRVARYVEELSHLDPIVALLPDDRIVALVRAVDEEDLWVEGFHCFSRLSDAQITRIAATVVRREVSAITAALEAFDRHHLWAEGLRLVQHLDPADLVTFADVLLSLDDALVDALVAVIEAQQAWDVLVRVALAADDLGDDVRARLRQIAERLGPATTGFEEAAADAGEPDLLARVLGR